MRKFFSIKNFYEIAFYFLTLVVCSPLLLTVFTKDNYILPKEIFITFLAAMSLFLIVLYWFQKNKMPHFYYPILFSFLLFLFFYAVSLTRAVNFYEASRRLLFLVSCFFLYIAGHSINNKKRLNTFFNVIFLVTVVTAVIGILQYLSIKVLPDPFYAKEMWKYKAFSTLGNPQFLAVLLIQVIPLVLVMFYVFEPKLLYFAGFLSFGAALAATNTRSAWLVLGVVLLVMLFCFYLTKNQKFKLSDFLKKGKAYFLRKNFILLIVFALLLAASLFSFRYSALNSEIPRASAQLKSLNSEKNVSVGGRLFIWKRCIEIFRDNYLTGRGIGNFKVVYPFYKAQAVAKIDFEKYPKNYFTRRQYAHNDYLEILAEGGLFTLMAFLGMAFFMVVFCIRNLLKIQRTAKPFLIGIFCSELSFLLMGIFFFPISLPASAALFFLNLGVLESYVFASSDGEEKQITIGRAKKFIYLESIFLIGVVMCFMGFKILLSDYYLKEGQKALQNKDIYRAVKSFEKGLAYASDKGQLHYGMGYLEYTRGNYSASLPHFLLSSYLLPERGVYYTMGRIFTLLGKDAAAKNAYRSAIKIDPHFGDAYLNLGILEAKAGAFTEAVKCFEFSAKYGRSTLIMVSAFNNLANCYSLLGETEKAKMYKARASMYLELGKAELKSSDFVNVIK